MTLAPPAMAATREALGPTLVRLREEGLDIVVVDADLGVSTTARVFAAAFPERFFTVGIAEQNMIGVAAGLAAAGKIAVASTFAVFAPGRCFDQIRISVAQPHLNVKLIGSHGGHQRRRGRHLRPGHRRPRPRLLPGWVHGHRPRRRRRGGAGDRDGRCASPGPFYIRCARPKIPVIYDDTYRFQLGKAHLLRPGKDVTIIALGIMVKPALDAAASLQRGRDRLPAC